MDFADPVIKEQMVNILAILSQDFKETYLFENILISGETPDTVLSIPEQHRGKILAYVLDYNELAYGIFYLDEKSVAFYEKNLRWSSSGML